MTHDTNDPRSQRDERSGAERCWIWRDSYHYPQVSFTKPLSIHTAVEYMRVLSRSEVERLAEGEDGCDTQQYMNSLHRRIENQLREINRLRNHWQGDKQRLLGILKEVTDNVRSVDLMSARDADGNYSNLAGRIDAELAALERGQS